MPTASKPCATLTWWLSEDRGSLIKSIKPPLTYPLKCLKDKNFRRVFFKVLPYKVECRVRQAFVIVCGDWKYVNLSTPIYEKLLAEDGLLEGLPRYRGERARLLTLFEEDKEPFFSPKPSKGWIEHDSPLLSRKVSL